jgi:hypothetical protein
MPRQLNIKKGRNNFFIQFVLGNKVIGNKGENLTPTPLLKERELEDVSDDYVILNVN